MQIKTPLSRIKYGAKKEYTRPFKIAIQCWWEWDVLPWFIKSDYNYSAPDKKHYRWERLFK